LKALKNAIGVRGETFWVWKSKGKTSGWFCMAKPAIRIRKKAVEQNGLFTGEKWEVMA